MAFFKVVALDLDGTLTWAGRLAPQALAAMADARSNGLAIVLVSGRIGSELQAEFPEIADYVDTMVLENGAVTVINGHSRALAPAVDTGLIDALTARGIPYRRGQVLIAIDGEYALTIVDIIGELGLDYQITRNRGALMVLPAGITKGTGLATMLAAMNFSPHNALAVGDAENDLSLFAVAEIGVAVANAVSSVRRCADVVLDKPNGTGVAELLTGPHLNGAQRWCPSRRWVGIGTFDDGSPTKIPGSQGRIVVTGPAASGKSYLVGLLAERWISANYAVVLLDPEGDHVHLRQLNQVQVIDTSHHLPEPAELVNSLNPQSSVVVDMSGLDDQCKTDYMHRLRSTAEAHREQHGYPHWVIYDEAHLLGTQEQAHWARRAGYVLSSFAPASLPAKEIDSSDVVLTLTSPEIAADIDTRRRATIRFGSGPARLFTIAERLTPHVRHCHKYADIQLPEERRFYFHTTRAVSPAPAATLHDFCTAVEHLDQQALEYHLERGDFSHWLEGTIVDRELATRVAAWEDELEARRAADLERIRHNLVRAIEQRYLPAQESQEPR